MSDFLMNESDMRLFIAWSFIRHPIRYVRAYRSLSRRAA